MSNNNKSGGYVPIYFTQDEYDAKIVKSCLEAGGFKARIHLDARVGYGIIIDPLDNIKVLVPVNEAEAAVEFLTESELEVD
ncbi:MULTISPECIES: hypothetical protein [unclassified Candidatus Frackibacter]|uniref:hypothetical protein n=1 Tax=unclassified Candidatus Frackibacter TaxID=2648818 RepID=UPI00088D2054|nr:MULTISPECIES: hypothetical protein [unclassified Candidatus Frackibacter]SDC57776.1 hypothetical protein SAMN04515661_11462 [Candidatus Frackibacter sp. WG11]SEM71897.1 hypothetical protein SAMN04488698_11362 [Candidatus Frackibacter sp. WG12]SFL82422.1 hypothetical protein SAMN04488699_11521 [Candidatus Frackibacter sp. WG13]